MVHKKESPFPFRIQKIQKRFETWRESRAKRSTIPEALWKSAVCLSKTYGVHRISKALRLNHSVLKKRVHEASIPSSPKKTKPSLFVELDTFSSPFSLEGVLEMERSDGMKMKMHLKGFRVQDLLALSQAFWGQES